MSELDDLDGLAKTDEPHSPHHKAGVIGATVYVAGAIEYRSFTDEDRDLLETSLTEAGSAHTIETYPARYGSALPDNLTYDEGCCRAPLAGHGGIFGSALS